MKILLTFLLLLSISLKVTAQEDEFKIQTNVSHGFSKDVLKVTETDAQGSVTVHTFNDSGYLTEYNYSTSFGTYKHTFKYEGDNLVETTTYDRSEDGEGIKKEIMTYENRRIALKERTYTYSRNDKKINPNANKSVKTYVYERDRLKSTIETSGSERTEEEEYYYNPGDSLVKVLVIKNKRQGEYTTTLIKDYKNGSRFTSDYYRDGDTEPFRKETSVYNGRGQLLGKWIFYDGSWDCLRLCIYSPEGIPISDWGYLDGGMVDSFYNEHGDLVTEITEFYGTFMYINEYNSKNDLVVVKKVDGKIEKRFEYVYAD